MPLSFPKRSNKNTEVWSVVKICSPAYYSMSFPYDLFPSTTKFQREWVRVR